MKGIMICFSVMAIIVIIAIYRPSRFFNNSKKVTVVYKLFTPGAPYRIRSTIAPYMVSVPARYPNTCKLVVFVQNGLKDTVMVVPVNDSVFNSYQVCDTLRLFNLIND